MSGVIFLKGVPDGFFEHEQRDYFSQFGKVQKVRVLRSKKTNRSRGCAWVKFAEADVAQIAADSMHNYLMGATLLKCVHLSAEEVPEHVFDVKQRSPYWRSVKAARQMNSTKTPKKQKALRKRLLANLQKSNARLAALGIEYKLDVSDVVGMPPAHTSHEVKSDVKEEPVDSDAGAAAVYSSDSDTQQQTPPMKKSKNSAGKTTRKLPENSSTPKLHDDAAKYSLLLDSSDDEICFATPPLTEKKRKMKTKSKLEKSTDSMTGFVTANDESNYATPEAASFAVKKRKKSKKAKC